MMMDVFVYEGCNGGGSGGLGSGCCVVRTGDVQFCSIWMTGRMDGVWNGISILGRWKGAGYSLGLFVA